jgi:hypothetical protein
LECRSSPLWIAVIANAQAKNPKWRRTPHSQIPFLARQARRQRPRVFQQRLHRFLILLVQLREPVERILFPLRFLVREPVTEGFVAFAAAVAAGQAIFCGRLLCRL